jgi:acetyl esterase/lipase
MLAAMKNRLATLAVLGWIGAAQAQPTNSFPLWPDGAPGARGAGTNDTPTLTPFFPAPEKATGLTRRSEAEAVAALVICPGGGYGHLAKHEGEVYAQWLNEHGVAAFVLKYRLGSAGYRHPAMLQDAARAVRTVRAKAAEWKLDPKRIGLMGSSAGGHLTATLLTHFDAGDTNAADAIERQSSRPDLGILCYPVITMDKFTHKGSRNNLLGTNAPPELVSDLSNELQVTSNTPPCFLWHTFEDKTVPVENALMFADALRRAGVPFELRIYEKGSHGLGLGVREWPPKDPDKLLPWSRDCLEWLRQRGFAN